MLKTAHELESLIIQELNNQLDGLIEKSLDFNKDNFQRELSLLKSDTLYPTFNLDTVEYTVIRLMGRMSISIGRRLGELYDTIPRNLAMHRYDLNKQQVSPLYNGLAVDVCLSKDFIEITKFYFIETAYLHYFCNKLCTNGLGIEIRYNFNPNDSSRLRKDCVMAQEILSHQLTPIYLVYSSISPRDEAIARLQRSGWNFLIGQRALDFSSEILGLDVSTIWRNQKIKNVIHSKINEMMNNIKKSYGIQEFIK